MQDSVIQKDDLHQRTEFEQNWTNGFEGVTEKWNFRVPFW